MNIRTLAIVAICTLSILVNQPARAQSADAAKQAAMERYLRAVPMSKLMEDSYAQMATQIPPEKRARFIADMRSVVRIDRVEQIARGAMLKTFSTEELNALADFYSSRHGASAMAKFGTYMGEIMPPLMQEIQRSVQELQARKKQ